MNFSNFQIDTIKEIEQLPSFNCFVLNVDGKHYLELNEPTRQPGPYNVIWYDVEGHLNMWKVGVNRILNKIRSDRCNSSMRKILDADDEYMYERYEQEEH